MHDAIELLVLSRHGETELQQFWLKSGFDADAVQQLGDFSFKLGRSLLFANLVEEVLPERQLWSTAHFRKPLHQVKQQLEHLCLTSQNLTHTG